MSRTHCLLILLIICNVFTIILFINNNDVNIPNCVQRESSMVSQDYRNFSFHKTWHHLVFTVRNMWYFMYAHSQRGNNEILNKYVQKTVIEYYRTIWHELNILSDIGGFTSERNRKVNMLGNIVQNRIDILQNPKECNNRNVIVCNLTRHVGFASSMHDVLWCFVKAYQLKKMMLLDISVWQYKIGNWEYIFQPLSRTCSNMDISNIKKSPWPGNNGNKYRFDLTLLPSDLGPELVRFIDQPLTWWFGQFMRYLLRPSANFERYLRTEKTKNNFYSPIVGVHVRRTDKVDTEAKYHHLGEYMKHVEDYYRRLELPGSRIERRVFIATDDPKVISEFKTRYPRYKSLSFPQNAEMASEKESRYSKSSLWGTVLELLLLAECDFVVCTFSSGFCRLAYELMYSIQPDASNKIHSLDLEFYYASIKPLERIAVYSHQPNSKEEFKFRINDSIIIDSFGYQALKGKLWDGFSLGRNHPKEIKENDKEEKSGNLCPSYKTIDKYKFEASETSQ